MKAKDYEIDKITVGERFRIDMGDLAILKESIKEKGVIQPITLDEEGNLVAGGRRLEACRELGEKTIPAVIRKIHGELDLREIELLENTARKDMEWAEQAKLEERIFELKSEQDPNWSIRKQSKETETGYGAVQRRLELAKILEAVPELAKEDTAEGAWKKYKKLEELAVVEMLKQQEADSGTYDELQTYADGAYIVGDAIVGLSKLPQGSVDFVEVDPPYGVRLDKRKSRNKDSTNIDKYNEVDAEEYPDFLASVIKDSYQVMANNSFIVFWFGMTWMETVKELLRSEGFRCSDIPCIWYKGGQGQTASPDTMLGSSYEPFFIARKGTPKLAKTGRSNVFHFDPVAPQNKIHSTERPIELMEEILEVCCFPGTMACVPFLGSGVTLRALYNKNMKGMGWDLSERNKMLFTNKLIASQIALEDDDEE